MLKLYITSTIISVATVTICLKSSRAKLTREGYKAKMGKVSPWEVAQAILYMLFPIYNILIALKAMCGNDLYEILKNNSVKAEENL